MACQLAQKSYASKVILLAKDMIKQLEGRFDAEVRNQMIALYNNLSADRKKIVTPYILPDDEYAMNWEQKFKMYCPIFLYFF